MNVSSDKVGKLPVFFKNAANFDEVVVLPEPFNPTIMITEGFLSETNNFEDFSPSILINCS